MRPPRDRCVGACDPAREAAGSRCGDNAVLRRRRDRSAERKLLEIKGSFSKLAEAETLLLQKTGFPCVCANNAYEMCRAVPYAAFLDMHARHGSGAEMNLLSAYGAAVGSEAARARDDKVRGFIGSSQDLTAPFFGLQAGLGTMPHALIGMTDGDAVAAMKSLVRAVPDSKDDHCAGRLHGAAKSPIRWPAPNGSLRISGCTRPAAVSVFGSIPMAVASPKGWTSRNLSKPSVSGSMSRRVQYRGACTRRAGRATRSE